MNREHLSYTKTNKKKKQKWVKFNQVDVDGQHSFSLVDSAPSGIFTPGVITKFHQLLHPIFWQMWFYVEMKLKKNTTKQTHKNEHNCARNCLKARGANHSLLLPGSAPHQSEMSFVGGQWEHGCRVKMPFRSRRQAQQKAATHFIQSAHDSLPSLQVYIHTNSVSIINTKYNRIRRLTWVYRYTNT